MKINRKLTLAIVLQAVLVLGVTQMSIFVGTPPSNESQIENKEIIQQGHEISDQSKQTQNEIFPDLSKIQHSSGISTNFVFFIVAVSIAANIVLILIIIRILRKDDELKARNQKFTALGELAAKIAHDLRNPLFVLQSEVETLISKYDNVESEDTRLISKSVSDIKHLINDILNFKKPQMLVKKLISYKQLVLESLEAIPIPTNTTVTVSDFDKTIYCDPLQIKRVIINIVHNSVAAIGEKPGKIQIEFLENSKFIICQIKDSGPGIKKQDIKKIYQPMHTTKPDGTGLGLYSSKSILEQHDGKLTFNNDPTTFKIFIPKYQITKETVEEKQIKSELKL